MATTESGKRRWWLWGGITGGAVLWWTFLPLFHIVPLERAKAQAAAESFDPGAFVERFWEEELLPSADDAVAIDVLRAAFSQDPKAAAEKYGHRLGLSGQSSYWVTGKGKVSDVAKSKVIVALADGGKVVLPTGPIFGNAIRDGSGLLNVSDFADSQDFNGLSSEINRRVEESVLPQLREQATVGAELTFVGGVEIRDSETALDTVTVVPVQVAFP